MKDKIKFYNADIFKQENRIEISVILICAFLIGFIAGYLCITSVIEDKYNMNNIVIEKEE